MKTTFLKVVLFLLCLPSGGILLLKAYGVADMHITTFSLFLPSIALLIILFAFLTFKKSELKYLVVVGALGGLVGTFGYDLFRVPFMLMGSRIFVPINMYGLWLTDASSSSSYSDLVGWLYHFSNGVTFGIMYAVFMREQSFWWAILYALLLETIFVISPFGELFGLTSKPMSLVAAYLGHVAYGYPLGKMVQSFEGSVTNIKYFKKGLMASVIIVILGCIALWNMSSHIDFEQPKFILSSNNINPNFLRVDKGSDIQFENHSSDTVSFHLPLTEEEITVEQGSTRSKLFNNPGIYHILVKNKENIRGVFVLCEPVEKFKE